MRYYVGVDGGSSRLDAMVVDETGRRCGRGHSGPIYSGRGQDHPNARVHLLDAVDEALVASGINGRQVAEIFLSCSNWTWRRKPDAVEWLAALHISPGAITVSDDGDVPAAWAAAGFPDPAIMVTLGTFWASNGVVDGREFPHLTDNLDLDQDAADLAQGTTIGSMALGAAIRSQVHGPATQLYDQICETLGLEGLEQLRAWAKDHDSAEERAWLCEVAARTAHAGDKTARYLFERAGISLAHSIIPMAFYMHCDERPLQIALSGNVWRAGSIIIDPFTRTIHTALPQATVHLNDLAPEEGAAVLALRIGHLHVDLHD